MGYTHGEAEAPMCWLFLDITGGRSKKQGVAPFSVCCYTNQVILVARDILVISPVEEIKNKLDVLEVVQGYLKLQKAGSNWKGLCPFHSEKTPSFMVSPSRQMWHCFGCAQGGDIFTFVSKIEGVEFADALRLLADKAGVKLSRQDPQVQSKRKRLYEACELAARFFERQLVSIAGQAAAKYLHSRGVSPESIKNFRIGWAPDSWQSLRNFLSGEGYSDQETEATGLIVKGESRPDEYHDRFRHRIMFPIGDSQGQVIGFSGRLFDKIQGKTVHADAGKYINTPSTALYDKSRALYGLDKARGAMRQSASCVLVEGNLDVVLSHQAGVENTVAPCGTAFSLDHFKVIKRYSDRLLLAFDADEAGDAALQRSVGTALSQGFRVMVAAVPLGKDAADVVKEDPKLWLAAVEKPVPYIEYILARSVAKFPSDVDGKKAVLATVLPFVKSVYSPLERDHWLQEVAQRLSVGKDVVTAELKLVAAPSDQVAAAVYPAVLGDSGLAGPTPKLRQEEYLLALLIKYPGLRKRVVELDLNLFEYPHLAATVKGLTGEAGENQVFSPAAALASDLLEEFVVDPEAEFSRLAANLNRQHLQSQLKTIQADIKKAELTGDKHNLELLLAEFNNLSKNLNEI